MILSFVELMSTSLIAMLTFLRLPFIQGENWLSSTLLSFCARNVRSRWYLRQSIIGVVIVVNSFISPSLFSVLSKSQIRPSFLWLAFPRIHPPLIFPPVSFHSQAKAAEIFPGSHPPRVYNKGCADGQKNNESGESRRAC